MTPESALKAVFEIQLITTVMEKKPVTVTINDAFSKVYDTIDEDRRTINLLIEEVSNLYNHIDVLQNAIIGLTESFQQMQNRLEIVTFLQKGAL